MPDFVLAVFAVCGTIWVVLGLCLLALKLFEKFGIDTSLCPLGQHQFGPIYLRHWNSISCERAIEIASWAGGLWELLRGEFPAETEAVFILELIRHPRKPPGSKPWGESRAVVNLWGDRSDQSIKGTTAEELHHLVRARRQGDEKYVYPFDPCSDDLKLERILYYALNPPETEALRFCVRATGDREDLLCEVEEYRAGRK